MCQYVMQRQLRAGLHSCFFDVASWVRPVHQSNVESAFAQDLNLIWIGIFT